jgi:hypothetical protein
MLVPAGSSPPWCASRAMRSSVAADPDLAQAAELARALARAHQGAATQLIGEYWAHSRKYFSLSDKYGGWAGYRTPARGFGIHAYAHTVYRPKVADPSA